MAESLPEIHATEVDGIPTYWSPVPGPLTAALCFRVGAADEAAPLAGVSHLIEHLALAHLGQTAYDTNGFVDDVRTTFIASGSTDEVVGFLNHVVTGLAGLPVERLAIERDILLSEFGQREWAPPLTLRMARYGPRGYGLSAGDQIGLDWLPEQEVLAWAARHFVTQRAVLWLSAPPPAGLALGLPAGESSPPPSPEPVDGQAFPMQMSGPPDGLALSVVGRRLTGLGTGWRIAERALRTRLRFQEGVIYDLSADYSPLTADHAEGLLAVHCRSDRAAYLAEAIVAELTRLAESGPSVDEIRAQRDLFVRQMADPMACMGVLDAIASDHLLGRFDSTPEHQLEFLDGLAPADVAAGMSEAMTSAMLMLPEDLPLTPGFNAELLSSPRRVSGREFKPAGGLLRRPKAKLTVGPDGVTLDLPDNRVSTVRYDSAAVVWHTDDNGRVLLGHDNFRVGVNATEWRDGSQAIALIDAATPAPLIACTDHRPSTVATAAGVEPLT